MCAISSNVTDSRRTDPSASKAIRASSNAAPARTIPEDRAFIGVVQITGGLERQEIKSTLSTHKAFETALPQVPGKWQPKPRLSIENPSYALICRRLLGVVNHQRL